MKHGEIPRLSTALPADAAAALMRAARTEITRDDPKARAKAIDQAIAAVQQQYPHLFKETQP